MSSISDRLKSLGVQLGARDLPPSPDPGNNWPIEKVVPGRFYSSQAGDTYLTQNTFGAEYSHGNVRIFDLPGLAILGDWARTPNLHQSSVEQIAFIDTETSGLAGGTGTYAFMVGLGFFRDNRFNVIQFFMRDPGAEAALLTALAEWITPFTEIVSFNGKSFDLPLLKTRYMLNGIPAPFENLEHIDLLHLARRLWKNRLESRAMGDLERTILQFSREQEEVPGYLIPAYYFDYLKSGDARPLAGVFYHNVVDIVSLAALFNYMGAILESPQKNPLPSLDVAAIARLYEEHGRLEEAAGLYETCLREGMPEDFFISTLQRFALLRRKQGNFEQAAALWIKAASYGDFTAYVELSKFHEHVQKSYGEALDWAVKGLDAVHQKRMARYQMQIWEDEFQKRIERLSQKSKRQSGA